MFSVAESSIKHSVIINMLTVAILVFGLITMATLPREEYPAVDFGIVLVIVPYPGVSPEEVEQLICSKVESEITDLEGIDYIQSRAEEGKATIMFFFTPSRDPEKAFTDVSNAMAMVTDLPSDAMKPIIMRLNMREVNPICQVVLKGEFSPISLRLIADNCKDGLLNVSDVSKVELVGARDREMHIDADQAKLDAYGITLNDLMMAVQGRNLNVPGGTSRFGKIEFLVRTLGEFNSQEEIASMIVQSDANGREIRIGDVATVRDTLAKAETIARLNMVHSTNILVYKKGQGNIIKVMKDVRAYLNNFEKSIPGLQTSVRDDGSIDVKNGINALGSNALMGIVLVFFMMFIFLGWRNALFASFGIPLSMLLAFIFLPYLNVTLNNLTIFGMIICVGMVVDDAIVVLENTHRHREMGYGHRESIVMGVDQVIVPVVSSTLTTIASFMPLLLMKGTLGKFLGVLPIVVTLALLGSLFQAMVVLPNNIYQFGKGISQGKDRTQKLLDPLVKLYQRILRKALKHRQITVWSAVGAILLSIGVLGTGAIKFEFFPSTPSQTIILQLQTPLGTTLSETERLVAQVEDHILKMKEKSDIAYVVSNVGSIGTEMRQEIKSSNAQISMDLVDLKKMKYTHDQIKASLRDYLEKLPGLYSYKFTASRSGPPVGSDVEIRIKGEDMDRLKFIAGIVKEELKKIPGVIDLGDNLDPGKKEIRIIPNQDKMAIYGLTTAQVAMTIRTASNGTEVSKYRGSGVDEYPIIVKLDDKYTSDLEILKNLKVKTRTGDLIAIRDLADFQIYNSLSGIDHRDKKRMVSVTASVSGYMVNGHMKKRTSAEVLAILIGDKLKGTTGTLSDFEKRFPGYIMEFGGQKEEQMKSYKSLYQAFLVALLIIFTILAAQFKSYVQPLIVMSTIPFGFIGVIIGLLVTGLPFSVNTLISVVALAGVVVKNAILMIDFINREREAGTDRWHAIINAGSIRLRPILMTTGTAIVGMMPLVFSQSPSTQAWRPLAVSFTFGLGFATMLTLFIIPCIYSMVDSLFGKFGLERFKEHSKFDEVMKEDEMPSGKSDS